MLLTEFGVCMYVFICMCVRACVSASVRRYGGGRSAEHVV
jgi:hypothetical protein